MINQPYLLGPEKRPTFGCSHMLYINLNANVLATSGSFHSTIHESDTAALKHAHTKHTFTNKNDMTKTAILFLSIPLVFPNH